MPAGPALAILARSFPAREAEPLETSRDLESTSVTTHTGDPVTVTMDAAAAAGSAGGAWVLPTDSYAHPARPGPGDPARP